MVNVPDEPPLKVAAKATPLMTSEMTAPIVTALTVRRGKRIEMTTLSEMG
jgi:hypothetical protein